MRDHPSELPMGPAQPAAGALARRGGVTVLVGFSLELIRRLTIFTSILDVRAVSGDGGAGDGAVGDERL